jgi:GMP synthase-like glutamine amidotransferase
MEQILIVTHDSQEGPGTLETFLESAGIDIQMIRLHEGDSLPGDPRSADAVVSMGGPMSVHDEEHYPFLRSEKYFLMQAIEANVPVLGICLGAQLIANACHAAVLKAQENELGWYKVSITDEGKRDILFQGLSDMLFVFQWHEDVFEIPEGATLLATSPVCPNQAFRYRNAYGLQFHVEVTKDMLSQWLTDAPEGAKMIRTYNRIAQDFERQSTMLYSNFLWLADIRQRSDKVTEEADRY